MQGCAGLWCVGNSERVKVSAVNAAILAHSELVSALHVTAAADGCDGPVREEGVNEGFHACSWCLVKVSP